MNDSKADCLSSRKFKIYKDYDLSKHSSIKVGGVADAVRPRSASDFIEIIARLRANDIRFCVVGGMSNTLFATDAYSGVVVITTDVNGISLANGCVRAECGVTLASLMSYAAGCGYGGAEQLSLIPGTVGGAIRGNAGAHGLCISDVLDSVTLFFSDDLTLRTLPVLDVGLSYRSSIVKTRPGVYVVSADFKLAEATRDEYIERRRRFSELRHRTQPNEPSLGSVFKQVNGVSAGYYIERAGLKGYRLGGAEISSKHAGFIVTHDGATWRDVMSLIELAEKRVHSVFGIYLEREVEIIR